MPKAKEAFRNIGEVADELAIKKHVLRFWEQKFPQLRPMKRGGGRRLYRPSDMELLKGIQDLLQNAGYTIKGVQKILREQGVEQVKKAATRREPSREGSGAHSTPHLVVKERPLLLSALEARALRTVMAELAVCHALLTSSPQDKSFKRTSRTVD